MVYAVDFDGTLSLGHYPEIGAPNLPLFDFLRREQYKGGKVILWTCRSGRLLKEAVAFCNSRDLHFDAINENLPENIKKYGGDARKVNADYYIDDKTLCFPGVDFTYWKPDGEELDGEEILSWPNE